MTRAILLDLDGTLIDSLPGIRASCLATLDALGYAPDPTLDFTALVGPPLPQVMHRLLQPYGDDRIDHAVGIYRAYYAESGMYAATLYPGMAEVVARLHATGTPLFVATSKRTMFARPILQRLGLADAFRGIYGTEADGSLDDKADLVAALLSAEQLVGSLAVLAGDRSHDVHAARANGVSAVGVLWGYGSAAELQEAGADRLVATPEELAHAVTPRG